MAILDWIAISRQNIEHLQARAQRLWEKSNVGATFKDCTFEAFETEGTNLLSTKQKCQGYAEQFTKDTGAGLLLYGDYGVGKTHLVTAVANYLVYTYGVSAYFTTAPDLISQIQKSIRSYLQDGDDIKRTAKEVDVLILDDLGREKGTEWNQQVLFELVDHRYRAKKPMLITSNLTPQQLSYQAGEATLSRLINMSECIQVTGRDYRTSHRQSFEEVIHPVPF